MIMEVMIVMEKVQENQIKKKILHAVREADIVSNRVMVTSPRPCLFVV